jgi:hypothetical protein
MSGPIDTVTAQAAAAARATHGQLRVTPGKAQGTAEATLTLPVRTGADKAFAATKQCIEAKLSCAFHGETVKREVRAFLG